MTLTALALTDTQRRLADDMVADAVAELTNRCDLDGHWDDDDYETFASENQQLTQLADTKTPATLADEQLLRTLRLAYVYGRSYNAETIPTSEMDAFQMQLNVGAYDQLASQLGLG